MMMCKAAGGEARAQRGRARRLAAQQHLRAALVLPLLLAIKPPPSFARVEQGVYRSGVFGAEHFEFVARLHLKTLLHVSPDYLLRSLVRFSQDNSIRLVNLGAHESWTDVNSPLKSEFVKEALEVVLNPENHPILVMCTTGLHHSGAIFGALRQMQGWAFTSIVEEFRRFGSADLRVRPSVEHFIERFDVDLVTLPREAPWWITIDQQMRQEEEAVVRHGQALMSASSGGCGPLRT